MSLLWYYYTSLPKRLERVYKFLFQKDTYRRPLWFLEWPLLLLDIIALPEILQLLHRIIIWNQRKMSAKEKQLAYPIFKDSIDWDNIRLNSRSLAARGFKVAFVSFHTVHFGDRLSDDILIHELVHIWQYQNFGSAYIVRALHAQSTKAGYKYGGLLTLHEKSNLTDFNFEQMAEVIRDAYLNGSHLPVYNKYIKQLLE